MHAGELSCPVRSRPRRLFLLLIVESLLVPYGAHANVVLAEFINLSLVEVRSRLFVEQESPVWSESLVVANGCIWRLLFQVDLRLADVVVAYSWVEGALGSQAVLGVRATFVKVIVVIELVVLQDVTFQGRKVSLSGASREGVLRCSWVVAIFSIFEGIQSKSRIR